VNTRIKIWGSPGCGKTTKLMDEIHGYQSLLARGYRPSDITVLTYRKSSAHDLIDKVKKYVNADEKELRRHVGTMHAICLRLIGYPEVITDVDRYNFVVQFGYAPFTKLKKPSKNQDKEENFDKNFEPEEDPHDIEAFGDEPEGTGDMFELYTWCHNTCTPVEKWYLYPRADAINMSPDEISNFFKNYDTYKRRVGKVDFSDMLQRIIDEKILLDTPILMIDEFQDLTARMYRIFEMWFPWCDYVVIAGDPFQSIYGYMGGSPEYYTDWFADEIILGETHRLPEHIKNYCQAILKAEGMKPPEIMAKSGYGSVVLSIEYDDEYPEYPSELHLIRCNYQAPAIALRLAEAGKVFNGSSTVGWSDSELNLANAIIAIKTKRPVTKEQIIAIIRYFPTNILGITGSSKTEKIIKDNYIKENFDKEIVFYPQLQTGSGILKPKVLEILKSSDPTKGMTQSSKLFLAKITGVIDRKGLILPQEVKNRKILTIHTAKGLEADAVFLHTAITPAIQKGIIESTESSQAESRVWYVGSSRAKEILFIVNDIGKTYDLPSIANVPINDAYLIGSIVRERIIKRPEIIYPDW
jgi:DNA helicase II / ATP-dependent DNA helicase PcrA